MVTEHGIQYAVHIVTNHFGNLVAKVCECLLRKGPLPIQRILRYTELTVTQVKNSLLVLIQQNCVQSFILQDSAASGNGPKLITQYLAVFDNILHRARFPKFLAIVNQQFDKPCEEFLEGLLQHGRLTLKQMFDKATDRSTKDGNSITMDILRENLRKLLMARFVERCPIPEPLVEPPQQVTKPAKKTVESETLEQRVLSAAVPVEAMRFSLGMDPELTGDIEKNETNSHSAHPGEKRRHDALEPDIDGGGAQEQVLWRANFEEFLRQLRHKVQDKKYAEEKFTQLIRNAHITIFHSLLSGWQVIRNTCIEVVRARLDDSAAIVVSAMLEASTNKEKKLKALCSVSLSMDSVYEEVIKNESGRNMTFDHVRNALVELSSPPPFVKADIGSYSIDFKYIIEVAQIDEVESIVLKRFGQDAYRIFRLLSKDDRLCESDKISDAVFVEKRDTTSLLYKLWQDGYLLMEKVVAGTTTYLLWKVNKQNLWVHVLDEMFHAALNLSHRVAYEMDQQKEIFNIPPERRVGAVNEKFEKVKKVRLLLESALMKLDDTIMLFHDF